MTILPPLSCEKIAERLKKHPHHQARILALLDVVENAVGKAGKADEAYQRLFDILRRLTSGLTLLARKRYLLVRLF